MSKADEIHNIMYNILRRAGVNPDHKQFEKMKAGAGDLCLFIDKAAQVQALAIMKKLQSAVSRAFEKTEADLERVEQMLVDSLGGSHVKGPEKEKEADASEQTAGGSLP
jgi:hypothetical protein